MALSCSEMQMLGYSFLDDELATTEKADVMAHRSTCPQCAAWLENQAQVLKSVRNGLSTHQATPQSIRSNILAKLDHEDEIQRKASLKAKRLNDQPWFKWLLPSSAVVAATCASAFALLSLRVTPKQVSSEQVSSGQVSSGRPSSQPAMVAQNSNKSDRAFGNAGLVAFKEAQQAGEYLQLPVVMPSFGQKREPAYQGWSPTNFDGRTAARFLFGVVDQGKRYHLEVHVLNVRDRSLGDDDYQEIAGHRVWMNEYLGKSSISVRDAEGVGYIFTSDMPVHRLREILIEEGFFSRLK